VYGTGAVTTPAAGGHAVFNEGGVDADFRVESDTKTHAFFVEGSSGNVGINNSSPASMLDVIEADNVKSHVSARYNTSNRKIGFNVNNSNGQGFLASNANQVSASDAATYDIASRSAKVDFQDGIELMTAVSGLAGATISYVNNLAVTPTTAVFNEGGADIDFRVESDGNANMLFVDGGANRVGIGRDPQDNGSTLQVAADATASTDLQLVLRGLSNENKKLLLGFDTTANIGSITSVESGVTHHPLHLQGSAFVWNEAGSDHDFRVESDNDSSALFVDGANGNVGIGSSPPTAKFGVRSTSTTEPTGFFVSNATTSGACLKVQQDGAGSSGPALLVRQDGSGNAITVDSATDGNTVFSVSNVGALSKASGSFKINHPLEAKTDTHHLVHSFIEGPQADNIYRGKVDLVAGSATANIDTGRQVSDRTNLRSS
jgi:hypothetical protein